MHMILLCIACAYVVEIILTTWWRHQIETLFALLTICAGNSPPVNSLHKGQWRGALMFSLICVWINGWVNNGEAVDLRRYRAHCDVTVTNMHNMVPYITPTKTTKYRVCIYWDVTYTFNVIFLVLTSLSQSGPWYWIHLHIPWHC